MQSKKWLSGLLSISLMFSSVSAAGLAAEYTDTKEHWASSEIAEWSDKEILQGSDGLFRPEAPITRGEMAIILDRVMKYQDKSSNLFTDLKEDWYTDAILKANAAGIVRGDGSTVRPMDNITREEATVMFGRALGLAEVSGASSFADGASISSWAIGYVNSMAAKNYVSGIGANQFAPQAPITRGEIVKMLDNAVQGFYTTAGTYGETVNGTAVVNASGVILKDATINGDLIIAEGVGTGEVTLENVKVTGQTIVRGGGENSIIAKNTTLDKVIIDKRISGTVAFKLYGNSKINNMVAVNGALSISGSVALLDLQGNVTVKLVNGKIETIYVASKANLTVDKASTVSTINIGKDAANTNINTEIGAKVNMIVAQAEGTTITGSGAITNVKAQANNVAVSTPNTKVEAAAGTSGVTAGGKELAAGSTATTNSSGSGITTPSSGSDGGSASFVVSNLYPAILKDSASPAVPANQLVSNYKVSGLKWFSKDYVDVTIAGNNLKYHQNGAGTLGSWIGFAIPAPNTATHMKTSFATTQAGLSLSGLTPLDERVYINTNGVEQKGVAFYANASGETPKTWAQVQWFDKDDKELGEATTYCMNLTGVKLDSSFVLDTENTAEGIKAAVTGISNATDNGSITRTYNITLSGTAAHGLGGNDSLDYPVINAALVGEGQAASYVILKDLAGTATIKQTNPALKYYMIDGGSENAIQATSDGDNVVYTKTKEYTNTPAEGYAIALLKGQDVKVEATSDNTTTVYVIKNEVTIGDPAADYTLTGDVTIAAGQTLTIAEGKTLTNAGTLDVKGTLINSGTVIGYWNITNGSSIVTNVGGSLDWDLSKNLTYNSLLVGPDGSGANLLLNGYGTSFVYAKNANGNIEYTLYGIAMVKQAHNEAGKSYNPLVIGKNETFTVAKSSMLIIDVAHIPNPPDPHFSITDLKPVLKIANGGLLKVEGALLMMDGARVVLGGGANGISFSEEANLEDKTGGYDDSAPATIDGFLDSDFKRIQISVKP